MADDHPTFRLGLKLVISRDDTFSIIGEVSNGAQAMELIRRQRPDVAVVDWDIPGMNGLDIVKQVRAERIPTRMIILTMHDDEGLVNAAVDEGVSGFVLKDNAVEDILDGLRAVRDGDAYLSPAVMNYVLKRSRKKADLAVAQPGLKSLTPSERRVLELVAAGRVTKEIADALSISPRTVETHRRNICEKLGLSGSYSLTQFAMENRGLL